MRVVQLWVSDSVHAEGAREGTKQPTVSSFLLSCSFVHGTWVARTASSLPHDEVFSMSISYERFAFMLQNCEKFRRVPRKKDWVLHKDLKVVNLHRPDTWKLCFCCSVLVRCHRRHQPGCWWVPHVYIQRCWSGLCAVLAAEKREGSRKQLLDQQFRTIHSYLSVHVCLPS